MYPDLHIHTAFSDDSTENPEQTVRQAVSLGMPSICITDHHDIDSPDGDFRLDTETYMKTLGDLREAYADTIDVGIGVEIGIEPHLCGTGIVETYLARYPFAYVVASLHFVDRVDPYYRDRLDMPDEDMYRRYFDQLQQAVCGTSGYQAVGHLDYIARYGRDGGRGCTYENYAEPIDAVLEHTVRNGLILEVNTAGYYKGLSRPHPQAAILRRYRELGGERICLGSDAHTAKNIGAGFTSAAELLRGLGFRFLTVTGSGGEKEIPL